MSSWSWPAAALPTRTGLERAELLAALLVLLTEPFRQPADEGGRLGEEPEPQQRVQAEAGVADPDVAVVPVPPAADLLGQARRDGGDDAAARLVAEHLERQ